MSVIEELDFWRESLPRICLWCRWGCPILFGGVPFLETLTCRRHAVDGLRSKKLTAPPWHDPGRKGNGDFRLYTPVMNADETCDSFEPVRLTDGKTRLLDQFGYLGK